MAKTSADADMLTRKSAKGRQHASSTSYKSQWRPPSVPIVLLPSAFPTLTSAPDVKKRTLNGRLRARSRQRAHSADHEVLEHQVAIRAALAPVVAEIGDLGGLFAAAAAEGRLEGGCCGLGGRGGQRAQAGGRHGRGAAEERCHCVNW